MCLRAEDLPRVLLLKPCSCEVMRKLVRRAPSRKDCLAGIGTRGKWENAVRVLTFYDLSSVLFECPACARGSIVC